MLLHSNSNSIGSVRVRTAAGDHESEHASVEICVANLLSDNSCRTKSADTRLCAINFRDSLLYESVVW